MPIETSLAKKVTRFQNSNDCFLAPLGNDRELDLAPLDVKNRVRNVTLRKNNLILLIFRYCFSFANLGKKYLGIECRLPTLLHEDPSSGETRTKSGNSIATPTPKK